MGRIECGQEMTNSEQGSGDPSGNQRSGETNPPVVGGAKVWEAGPATTVTSPGGPKMVRGGERFLIASPFPDSHGSRGFVRRTLCTQITS